MFDAEKFAAGLRTVRKQRGLSQKQLAEALHLSTQAVSKWEQGESMPDISRLSELSSVLQVSVDSLLGADAAGGAAIIGIDGGGTKTEFVLLSPEGDLLKRLVRPGCNPNVSTVEGAVRVLREGIDILMQQGRRVMGVYLGGSGMSSGNNGETMTALLREAYPGLPIRCETDICNLLAFARDPDNAIAIICGTGSVVFSTRDGKLQRFGGGGWRLETDGSGYDLGRQAILAALEHRDGTGPETCLTEQVEEKLGGRVWQNIQRLYAEAPAYLASFAPLTIAAWQQGDAAATAIVERSCTRMAHLVRAAMEHSPRANQLLMGGSVLTKSTAFREHFLSLLPDYLEPVIPQYPQVLGACFRCAAMLSLPQPDGQRFMKQYLREE